MMKKLIPIFIFLAFLALPKDAFAARLGMWGMEWQSATAGVEFPTVDGTPTVDTTTKHSGAASMEISGSIATGVTEDLVTQTFTGTATGYARWYLYVDAQDDSASVADFMDTYSGATNVTSIQCSNVSGTITCTSYYNNFGGSLANTFNINFDTWYRVEMLYDTSPANGSEILRVYLDGTEVASATNLNFTTKTINTLQMGVFNGTAGSISGTTVNFDDVAFNDNTGTYNNALPGDANIVIVTPNAAGDNTGCSNGSENYVDVQEVPPSDTATAGSTMCQLDSNGNTLDVNVTDSSTAGIDAYDAINAVSVMARVREEAAGTSSYQVRLKSAASGTVSNTASADAGNATARTNPNGTTAFGRMLISNSDPTSGFQWTPTGTNSIDNMQIGVTSADADSTPDLWVLTLGAMVEYVDRAALTPPSYIQEAETAWNVDMDATASVTTGSFSVQVGDVLVASSVNSDYLPASQTISNSGTALSWTQQQVIAVDDFTWLSIWTTTATAAESITVTFTRNADPALTLYYGGNVLTFRGSDGVGNSGKANAAGSTPLLNMGMSSPNSALVVFNGDWAAVDGASRTWRTSAGSLNEVTYNRVVSFYTVYGGYHADVTGTYPVGLSAPAAQTYAVAAVEIKGTTVSAGTWLPQIIFW